MGTILTIPFPQMFAMTITAIATRAIGQFCEQFWMAEPERMSPMAMMIGPVTTGGKKRITFLVPKAANRPERTKYINPAQKTPIQAYGRDSDNAKPFASPIWVTAA